MRPTVGRPRSKVRGFSERIGAQPTAADLLAVDEITPRLRNAIWNIIHEAASNQSRGRAHLSRVGRCVLVTRQALEEFIAAGGDLPNVECVRHLIQANWFCARTWTRSRTIGRS